MMTIREGDSCFGSLKKWVQATESHPRVTIGEEQDEEEEKNPKTYFGQLTLAMCGIRWRGEILKALWAANSGIKAMSLSSVYHNKKQEQNNNNKKSRRR